MYSKTVVKRRLPLDPFTLHYPLPLHILAESGDILRAAMTAMPRRGPGTRKTVVQAQLVAACQARGPRIESGSQAASTRTHGRKRREKQLVGRRRGEYKNAALSLGGTISHACVGTPPPPPPPRRAQLSR